MRNTTIAIIVLFCVDQAWGDTLTFATIDDPGEPFTAVLAVNQSGTVLGQFSPGATGGVLYSFLREGGTFNQIIYPPDWFYLYINPAGLNDRGQVSGSFFDTSSQRSRGFLKTGSAFQVIDFPGATHTQLAKLNNNGQIVGFSEGCAGGVAQCGAFVTDGTAFNLVLYPYPSNPYLLTTGVSGINDAGDIVGSYGNILWNPYSGPAFLKHGTDFSTFNFPGAFTTTFGAVNNSGQIIGTYFDAPGTHGHAFLKNGDACVQLDVPGAAYTQVFGIANDGTIAGTYFLGTFPNEVANGFLATYAAGPGGIQPVPCRSGPAVVPVTVDIFPRGSQNTINVGSSANLNVAIYSSPTFDATQKVDPNRMYFGPANSLGAPMRGTCNLAGTDLNGDGLPDVLCNFDPRTLDGFFGIPNQSEVEASFVTTDGVGTLFRGSVTIRIVGN